VGLSVNLLTLFFLILFELSPYLFVLGDDRVTCYTWAYNVSGGAGDA